MGGTLALVRNYQSGLVNFCLWINDSSIWKINVRKIGLTLKTFVFRIWIDFWAKMGSQSLVKYIWPLKVLHISNKIETYKDGYSLILPSVGLIPDTEKQYFGNSARETWNSKIRRNLFANLSRNLKLEDRSFLDVPYRCMKVIYYRISMKPQSRHPYYRHWSIVPGKLKISLQIKALHVALDRRKMGYWEPSLSLKA